MRGVLAGKRVVALEVAVAGPFCTSLLGDMGAEVIKIERPGGDLIRSWDSVVRGLSSGYVWVNRNKRSVVLDLKREGAREVARRLVERADVFVENYAPGVAEALGLGYEQVRAWNPRLVYCSISGYGREGPYREMKAYDLLVQAEAGMMAVTGYPDAPAKVGVPVADLAAGLYGALGIALALLERERTGEGQFVEVSMFEAMLAWLGYFPYHVWYGGQEPGRVGMRHHYIVPYGPFQTAEGKWICFAVASDRDWRRFCEQVIERPDLVEHPDYHTVEKRRQNRETLEPLLERILRTRSQEEWARRLQAAGLPWGLMRSIGEVLAHPQVQARGLIQELNSPVGRVKTIASPLRLERNRAQYTRVPDLGEDTVPVLRELGFSMEKIRILQAEGVVGTGSDTGGSA
ncbi:MAG: CoA transferase [Armatimonadota bacterium]|nr:CoA transferase [Armatimonadota bacterium]MDR7439486.1 CoA transferase [Armatimonadota bacterium]MDR7563137.1 CoA transferase [Armatimonadota bacterium]MDR7600946.1 CoA transferase [Armatimonadota bacterium]